MGILLLILGVLLLLGGGASALSRLAASEYEEKKSPRIPLLITAVGLMLGVVGLFQSIND
ncbi:MAG: hypothetical protein HYY01_13310 [Chloroflexi bacterium]|nr:hypothetical protein [Chloroflexota bacterium]